MNSKNILSERDEMLISKYFDNQCNWLQRRKVERLISSNENAVVYLSNLSQLNSKISSAVINSRTEKVDLWDDIASAISQEEKKARFLADEKESPLSVWVSRLGWGLSGAFVSASVAIFAVGSLSSNAGKNGIQFKSGTFTGEPEVQTVNFGNEPTTLNTRTNQPPMEIDWLRSDGRLKFIQSPNQNSTILWVNKRNSLRRNQKPVPKFTVDIREVR